MNNLNYNIYLIDGNKLINEHEVIEHKFITKVGSFNKGSCRFLYMSSKGNMYAWRLNKVISTGFFKTAFPEISKLGTNISSSEFLTNFNNINNNKTKDNMTTETKQQKVKVEVAQSPEVEFIQNSVGLRPKQLFLADLKWKYLVRSAVRGKNIMMTGDAGSGKTFAARSLVKALDRPDFYFNLGSTQDARAALLGNIQFNKESGTYFAQSAFIKAIQTPNAVILLDELTRAHPDAWNILMTVLDQGQRYLRIDEVEDSPIINVANGVTFIATANIGNEYTATRVIDRALLDRFTIIEMDLLDDKQEFELLKMLEPTVDEYYLKAIAEIAHHTRQIKSTEEGRLTEIVSTRASVEVASLIADGFNLHEAAEIAILPFFSNDGGIDSERTYVKQLIQKYKVNVKKESLFNTDEVDENVLYDNQKFTVTKNGDFVDIDIKF